MTDIYFDIAKRSGGEIFLGVVGPVRTGKSTFIKRFMELFVVPAIEDENEKMRLIDLLPQSGDGKTITTTEPKFIPEDAAKIVVSGTEMKVRMVDCVGYLVPGVIGGEEDGRIRMVKTPWSEEEISFENAASIGTTKVITDHSTVGILVTTDGSFGQIPRENFVHAEEEAASRLKELGKPFVIVLNTALPINNRHTESMRNSLREKYGVPVIVTNCEMMDARDFDAIFDGLLSQFPVEEVYIDLPDYLESLCFSHKLKSSILESVFKWMENLGNMDEIGKCKDLLLENENIQEIEIVKREMASGRAYLRINLKDNLYFKIIEEIIMEPITSDKDLFASLQECKKAKDKVKWLSDALTQAELSGYGIVSPSLRETNLGKPEIFKQGSKYGVRVVASAPCFHIIKTEVTTEIAPLVGSEEQSKDLADFLLEKYDNPDDEEDSIWETNLFGKSLKELVSSQMSVKLYEMPESLQGKVQRSLQKISNEGKDYFICIIL